MLTQLHGNGGSNELILCDTCPRGMCVKCCALSLGTCCPCPLLCEQDGDLPVKEKQKREEK